MLLVFGVCGILGLDIFAKVFAGVFGLGAVLAFALKDSVNDFFCGIYLRFNRHLDLGTYIEVVRADASVLGEIDIADGETDVNYKLPTGRELIGFVCKKGGGAAFAVGDWGEFCDDITTDDVLAFALVSRDSQWIHTDIERATAQFGGLVVHGALTASRVSALFGNVFPGSGTIYLESGINFKKMVIAPNKITVRATITEYTEKGTKGKMRLAVEITNQEGDIVAEGHALLLVAVTATSG
jgi:acyl dehydratase